MSIAIQCPEESLIEKAAEVAHESWSGWTKYMLSCLDSDDRDKHIARWRRQMDTKYVDLTEKEKESDRAEARKYLKVFSRES